ncbi:MAG: thiamine pyrophosphate-binding protein [Candidatus Tectomicrobia bacterium]|uniref:Thiamine pyrophosphate-binding protein n=1 Tax=Tectimicrobiota bacterium TaxID=2528274 RepID=A0A938B1U5_UNCTE|nr:thiamine pyrophosphate-binding protein [Candidatus Tectomicrobia bacterium]
MAHMSGRQAIMEIFRNAGVQYIFGNPGTTELGFVDILQEYPQLQYIMCLHEGVAMGAAHMYANASGKTGVVNLHVAPGLGNALGMLYNATIGKMPLVVTAGQQDSRMLVREPILSYDLVSMARPLVKWAVQLQRIEDIPIVFPRAFKVAQDAPRGPVFIALPGDIIDQEATLQLPGPSTAYRRTRPDPAGVAAAATLLAQAQRPVIICGDGVAASQAQAELVQMAEHLGAQVWQTVLVGALNFPNTHPQYRGELPGEHSAIRRALGDADVVMAVGAELFDEVFYTPDAPLPDGCALIQVDSASWSIGKNFAPTLGLLADPKLALQEMTELVVPAMSDTARQQAMQRRTAMAAQRQQERDRQEQRAQQQWDSTPIAPPRLMAALRDCLPANTVFYNEAITATGDMLRTLPLEQPGSLFGNHGGGIGQGLPGALGVQLAYPEQRVVALVGDGSSMYSVQSFWTAAHHNIPVVYIILSNRTYRILKYNMNRYRRTLQIPSGRPYTHLDLTQPTLDFVEIAHGMGVDGRRITHPDEIQPAVTAALALGKPYVLEVLTEGTVPSQ